MTGSSHLLRAAAAAALVIGMTALSGCANTMPAYSASPDNVAVLRSSTVQPMRVSGMSMDPGNKDARSVSVRASTLGPPEGSFADYLAQAARADLAAAGKLDPQSKRVLSGVLVRNLVDSGINEGTSQHVARFWLDVDGKRVFDKELQVDSKWDSSFIGAIAIPAAMSNFTAGFQKLLRELFSDVEFQKSAR
jgi:hypothetical protein